MSSKSAIEYLVEYPFNQRDLVRMPEDQQAVLAVLSYAVSEANALAKIYISASHELIDDPAIDCASSIQRFVVLRTWSAKLFEIEEFLQLGGRKKKTSDSTVLRLAKKALDDFGEMKVGQGYELVRDMRHEATNHYSFSAAKKNLKHISDRANCNMYLHEQNGNSFYPLGEEVMFIGRFNRKGASLDTKDERTNLINIWMNWNLKANKWLAATHVDFTEALVLDDRSSKVAKRKAYWVPMNFVGTKSEGKVPVFFRKGT